jgi:hypothetical protein
MSIRSSMLLIRQNPREAAQSQALLLMIVGEEMPVSRIVIAVPNATVVLLD